jgi:hypothetical protein
MGGAIKVRQASRTGTRAALYSQYYSGFTCSISRHHIPFSRLDGKIIKQHSSNGNELYLFLGDIAAFGGALVTVGNTFSTVRNFGGAAKMVLASHDHRQMRPVEHRQSSKLADFSPRRSAEGIHTE